MVGCFPYRVAEFMKDAHVLVWLDVPLCVVFIHEILPIEMLPILANIWSLQSWVCQGFFLKMGWSLSWSVSRKLGLI